MKRILDDPKWNNFINDLENDSSHWDVFLKKADQDSQAVSFEDSNASSRDKIIFEGMPHFKKFSCLLSLLCDFIFYIQKIYPTSLKEPKNPSTDQTDIKNIICFIHILARYLIHYHSPNSSLFNVIPRLNETTLRLVQIAKIQSQKILNDNHRLSINHQDSLNDAIDTISTIIIKNKLLEISSYTKLQLLGKTQTAYDLLANTDLFNQFLLILRAISPIAEIKQQQQPLVRLKTQPSPSRPQNRFFRPDSKNKHALLLLQDITKPSTPTPPSSLTYSIETMMNNLPLKPLIIFVIGFTQIQLIAAQADSFGFEQSSASSEHPLPSFIAFLCFSFFSNLTIKTSIKTTPKPQSYPLLLEDKPKLPTPLAETVNVEEQKEQRAPLLFNDKPKSLTLDQNQELNSIILALHHYTTFELFTWRHHKTVIRNLLNSLKEISNPIHKIETIVTKLNSIDIKADGQADGIKKDAIKLQKKILEPTEPINSPSAEGLSI